MENLDILYTDATCYESEMRYPTDQKLLWEGIEKSYETMCELSSRLGIHRPRKKFLDVQKANLTYRKQRKHSKSQTKKMTRRLIELLGKILKEICGMIRSGEDVDNVLTIREKSKLDIITKMYRQQKKHFESQDCRESIPDRIVSISKQYVSPIVRGKEVKSVEFGAKVNSILVDGMSFIEKLSFNPFSEDKRLIHFTTLHKRLFGVDVKKIGGDTGYAGTENRDFYKDALRQELARVRAPKIDLCRGTMPLPRSTDEKSGQTTGCNDIKRNFDEPNAENRWDQSLIRTNEKH